MAPATARAYGVMAVLLRRGERGAPVRAMLIWAVALAVSSTATFALWLPF